jgi:hypothetical protein
VNIVPFGQITRWDEEGKDYGVVWEDARDLFRVVVEFANGGPPPPPASVHLEYWQSQWPYRRIPRDQPSGAGSSGWQDLGDWFQGEWRTADANLQVNGATCTFTFNPVNATEYPGLGDFAATYRTTLQLRLVADSPLPAIESFEAYTDAVWQPVIVEIEWGGAARDEQVRNGHLEAFNGAVETVEPLPGGAVSVAPDKSWRSTVRGKTDGVRATILYAETKAYNSFDETVVTVRAAQETFSFGVSDLLKWGHVFVPDFGVLVRKAGDTITYAQAEQAWHQSKDKDLYSRVFDEPEQTFTRAWSDTPAKAPHYIPLSFEGGRQHFGLDEHGAIFCNRRWTQHIPGRDTERCLWAGDQIAYDFGLPEVDPDNRTLVDGCLPISVSTWEQDGVRYRQTAFVVPFAGVPKSGERILADDTLVLMMRFEMENIAPTPAEAGLDLRISDDAGAQRLALDNGLVFVADTDPRRLRAVLNAPAPAADYSLELLGPDCIAYRARLTPGDRFRTLEVVIPYVTFTDPPDWEQLRSLRFEEQFGAVRAYWRARVRSGAQMRTPEPMINDFYNAHVSHLLINTEREVGGSDRYLAKVGTFGYGVYSNESCMMISDLDRRGFHELAERALETWLHYQGTVGLPGDFSTSEGQFYGAGGYESGGYNQHHGWVLWCLGEHYWYTRDGAWLRRAAPHIVAGCDWIINERRRTIEEAERSPLRAIERGLLPPGRLEDIGDWRCWLSTNTYSWWGMDNAARALDAQGHPEGKRLLAEAEAYHQDILAAYMEAMRRSPVVRLRDGSWIPHIPPDVHRRGRSFGWITETLEGAIHLVRCGALPPRDRLATWIIRDFEDNLYLSEQYGYNLTSEEFERYWFSRGGISMQANLLSNPIPYLLRDEPKHFLRAYFNAFAVSYFPDTRMMTEHALPNIGDWRGDHYKSSDEANSTYWLRLMFVEERGDELWLGAAIPRYWLVDGQNIGIENASTYFGPMSVALESRVATGTITMRIEPPLRNPPRVIRARFRHPDGRRMTRVEVNGQAWTRFDPDREWVELPECAGRTRIVAHYD